MTGLQLHWQQWQQHAREQWSRRVELASWVGSCPDERSDSVDEWRRTHALCLHAWGRDSEHESSWAGIVVVWTGRPHDRGRTLDSMLVGLPVGAEGYHSRMWILSCCRVVCVTSDGDGVNDRARTS